MTIPGVGPATGRGGGLAEFQQRIGEIHRRIAKAAGTAGVSGLGVTGATANAVDSSSSSSNGDFALALQRAVGSGGSTSVDPTQGAWPSSGWSGLPLNGAGSAAPSALLDQLNRIPVYATKPDSLPPVTVSAAARAAGNGRLPDALLQPLGVGEHRLAKPAADAFRRLNAMARGEGITIGINDSYRDLPGQVAVADRVGLYSQGGWAAAPGTSNHGWGLALDLELDARGQAWMADNAWKFGFFEDTPGEPWHWTYRAG